MEAPKQIEAIIKYGSKSSTYKFAFLKALIEYVIEFPSEDPVNGFHYIPLVYIAKKFLTYYWPLWKNNIPQIAEGSRLSLYGDFDKFKSKYSGSYSLDSAESIAHIINTIETEDKLSSPFIKLLQHIRTTVIDMPLRYIPNIKGQNAQLFTVYHKDMSLLDSDYNALVDKGKKQTRFKESDKKNYINLERNEKLYLLIPHRVYEELGELRFWIRDVIIKNWAAQCEDYSKIRKFNYSIFLKSFEKVKSDRESLIKYRDLYNKLKLPDFYTGRELAGNFEIDHFLPWSRLPVNTFWNLVPTSKVINRAKSDNLIDLNDYIRDTAIPEHIKVCLYSDSNIVRYDIRSTYQKYFKREFRQNEKTVKELSQLVLHLYDNLDRTIVGEKYNINQ